MPRVAGIYVIIHIESGREYVGSAKDIRYRLGKHFRDLRGRRHHSPHLQSALSKYGVGTFDVMVLEECENVDLLLREQFHIDSRKPIFNVAPVAGNCAGVRHKPETIKKRSAATQKRWDKMTELERYGHGRTSSERMKEWWASAIPEQRLAKSTIARARIMDQIATMSPEQYEHWKADISARRAKGCADHLASLSDEQLRERTRNAVVGGIQWRKDHPEEAADSIARMKATKAARTPEQRQQRIDKFRATMAAKKARKQMELF